MLAGIDLDGLADRAEVGAAIDLKRLRAGLSQGGEQDGNQQCNDADDHEQFD